MVPVMLGRRSAILARGRRMVAVRGVLRGILTRRRGRRLLVVSALLRGILAGGRILAVRRRRRLRIVTVALVRRRRLYRSGCQARRGRRGAGATHGRRIGRTLDTTWRGRKRMIDGPGARRGLWFLEKVLLLNQGLLGGGEVSG